MIAFVRPRAFPLYLTIIAPQFRVRRAAVLRNVHRLRTRKTLTVDALHAPHWRHQMNIIKEQQKAFEHLRSVHEDVRTLHLKVRSRKDKLS